MASHRQLKALGSPNPFAYLPLAPLVHVIDGTTSRAALRPGPLREDLRARRPESVRPVGSHFGVDFSYNRKTIDDQLAHDFRTKHGVTFVVRYLAPPAKKGQDPGKGLTLAEAKVWSRAGIDLACAYEVFETRAAGRYVKGRIDVLEARRLAPLWGSRDAIEARRLADLCGMPKTAPIYFAVDYDVLGHDLLFPGAPDMPQILNYFRAIAEKLGTACTGAYGGYGVIKALFDSKLIAFGWQAYAWSDGQLDPRAQLYQYQFYEKKSGEDKRPPKHLELAGIAVDYDKAKHENFGQWRAVFWH